MNEFSVVFGDNFIRIDFCGEEVLYWTENEWKEDPKLVYDIANAVKMAYNEPYNLYCKLFSVIHNIPKYVCRGSVS